MGPEQDKCLGQTIMAVGGFLFMLLFINWFNGGSVDNWQPTFGPGFNANEQGYRPPVTFDSWDVTDNAADNAIVGCWGTGGGGQLHGVQSDGYYPDVCGPLARGRRRLHRTGWNELVSTLR